MYYYFESQESTRKKHLKIPRDSKRVKTPGKPLLSVVITGSFPAKRSTCHEHEYSCLGTWEKNYLLLKSTETYLHSKG